MAIQLSDVSLDLKDLRENGRLRAVGLGFQSWGTDFMLSRRYPVYIAGEPHHGKSTFTYEILVQLSEKYGFKHFCYFGEAGNPADIFAELMEIYIGKPYSEVRNGGGKTKFCMNEADLNAAELFIENHFHIEPIKEEMTLKGFYENLKKDEELKNIKYDCAVIDPVYDLEDFEAKEKVINRMLKKVNKECFDNNRIDFVVNHVSDTFKFFDKDKGTRKKMPALADEWYGGKVWQRRAFLQLLVFRPLPNDNPDEGEEIVEENETHIYIQKAKPNGIGKVGKYKLYFDWKKKRYYEKTDVGNEYPDCSLHFKERVIPEQTKDIRNIKPSLKDAFGETDKNDNDNFPF